MYHWLGRVWASPTLASRIADFSYIYVCVYIYLSYIYEGKQLCKQTRLLIEHRRWQISFWLLHSVMFQGCLCIWHVWWLYLLFTYIWLSLCLPTHCIAHSKCSSTVWTTRLQRLFLGLWLILIWRRFHCCSCFANDLHCAIKIKQATNSWHWIVQRTHACRNWFILIAQ